MSLTAEDRQALKRLVDGVRRERVKKDPTGRCVHCGTEFKRVPNGRSSYCSDRCRILYRKQKREYERLQTTTKQEGR